MRVLYVENDTILAGEVELMLRGLVREYDTTPLGQIGFELAEHKNYDVVLIDLMLPDIDGYEVVRRLRSAGVNTPYLILIIILLLLLLLFLVLLLLLFLLMFCF